MSLIVHRLSPYLTEHYGDIASVIGLVVTCVGFVATIRKVKEAQKSAEEAKKAAKLVVSRVSAKALAENVDALIKMTGDLKTAYRNREWAFAVYLCDELKIRITLLLHSQELLESEQTPINRSSDDFRVIARQLDRLRRGEELKRFEASFWNATTTIIDALCGIRSRAARDLMGKKDV